MLDSAFHCEIATLNFEVLFRTYQVHFQAAALETFLGSQRWVEFYKKSIFWGARNGPVSGPEMGPFWGPEMGPSLLISNWGAHFWTLKWAHFWPPKWAHFWPPKWAHFWDPKIYFFAELYRCLGPHITFPGPKPCLQSRAFHIFLPRTLFSEGLRLCWFVCRGGDIGMPYHALSLCCQRCITPNMDV